MEVGYGRNNHHKIEHCLSCSDEVATLEDEVTCILLSANKVHSLYLQAFTLPKEKAEELLPQCGAVSVNVLIRLY